MADPDALAAVVAQAATEGWRIHPPTLTPTPVCTSAGELAGFYCLHPAARGWWRVGPIYVRPEFRRRGLARAVYDSLAHLPLLAYVRATNTESLALHRSAGFRQGRRLARGSFWRRPARGGAGG